MRKQLGGDVEISTDRARLDVEVVHDFLCHFSYWAHGRPIEQVRRSIENSLCFGAYVGAAQVGFARVVTDYATFAWICDVFVLESHRGHGLGKQIIQAVVEHPALRDLRLMILATRDAHSLYSGYGGFRTIEVADRWMIRRGSDHPTDRTRQTPGA
ncbi:MAG: GNAT family N-acetyltransferase [Candidatus Bipolaricaulis sp.]|nr:GNAT family N-acetyltransferase [Candidatus Bipolaricaulis sp.]